MHSLQRIYFHFGTPIRTDGFAQLEEGSEEHAAVVKVIRDDTKHAIEGLDTPALIGPPSYVSCGV